MHIKCRLCTDVKGCILLYALCIFNFFVKATNASGEDFAPKK